MAHELFSELGAYRSGLYATRAGAVRKAMKECAKAEKVSGNKDLSLAFVVIATESGKFAPTVFVPEQYFYLCDSLCRAGVCVVRG